MQSDPGTSPGGCCGHVARIGSRTGQIVRRVTAARRIAVPSPANRQTR